MVVPMALLPPSVSLPGAALIAVVCALVSDDLTCLHSSELIELAL